MDFPTSSIVIRGISSPLRLKNCIYVTVNYLLYICLLYLLLEVPWLYKVLHQMAVSRSVFWYNSKKHRKSNKQLPTTQIDLVPFYICFCPTTGRLRLEKIPIKRKTRLYLGFRYQNDKGQNAIPFIWLSFCLSLRILLAECWFS